MENADKHLYLGLNRFVTSHVSKCRSWCRPFSSSRVTRYLQTVCYKDFLQPWRLLFIRTVRHLPAHIYVVVFWSSCPSLTPLVPLAPRGETNVRGGAGGLHNVAISNYPLQTALTLQGCSFAHLHTFTAIDTNSKGKKKKSKIHRVTWEVMTLISC